MDFYGTKYEMQDIRGVNLKTVTSIEVRAAFMKII